MFKTSITCLVFLLALAFSGKALQQQNPQLVFDRANGQLQNGNIPKALALYHSLESQKQYSGALFINMGLSYIKVDSVGKAKYYFLKAKQFEETEKEAEQALEYVETRFSHQSAVLPELPWQKALNWLSIEVGSLNLLAIGLILLNLGIIAFISTWFIKQSSSLIPRSSIGIVGVGLLIILLSFYTRYRQQRYSKGVMITKETKVVEKPELDAAIVNEAFEGYTFTVDETRSEKYSAWSYIRMSNGKYGWIATTDIMIL